MFVGEGHHQPLFHSTLESTQEEDDSSMGAHTPLDAQSSQKKQRIQRSASIDSSFFSSVRDASSQEKSIPLTDLSSAPLPPVLEGSARTRGGVQRSSLNPVLVFRRSLASLKEKTASSSDAPSVTEQQTSTASRPTSLHRMKRMDHDTLRALLSKQPSTSTDAFNISP